MEEQTNEALWYVVHTYSGYENKVANDLQTMVENRHLQDLIRDIKVPTEMVPEIKDGKERMVEHKLFPGYVLVKMVMNDDTWYVVRNTRGCTGFVGPASKPVPLSAEEVEKMGVEKAAPLTVDFNVGDTVQITAGPLEGFMGLVEGIDTESFKVKLKVNMFWPRDTRRSGYRAGRAAVTNRHNPFTKVRPQCGSYRACAGSMRSWEARKHRAATHHRFLEVHLLWHRKLLATLSCRSRPARRLRLPPVGPALGQKGVNIMAFTKEFNERTKNQMGYVIPVVITVYADRSFSFITKTPPAAVLIKKAAGIDTASGVPNKNKVGSITLAQAEEIAKTKMPDLNAASLEAAVSMIKGTARSMGVTVEG